MIYFITFLLLLSLALNVYVIYKAVNFARILLKQEESLEECLDGIDEVYKNVGKILELPLATNDPKVFQIHRQLKQAHAYLLHVANRLTSGWSENKENIGVDGDR